MKAAKTSDLLQFRNCHLLRNHSIIEEDLWIRNGKIINAEKIFFDEKIKSDYVIDCNGALISPGFIDIQINGGFGIDFSQDVTSGDIDKVSKGLLAHGVTAFCPTLVTSPVEVYHKVLPHVRKRQGGPIGAAILGAHVEGPFINPQKKGAHPAKYMQTFDKGWESLTDTFKSLDNVALITLAPEISGALDVIPQLVSHGITVSLGHSACDLGLAEKAIANGASIITHLFNAMLPFHHRDPGLVGLLASRNIPSDRTVHFGIISDGVHTHPAALRIAYKTHPTGVVLVTDAISALGLEEGHHRIGQMDIEIRQGRALLSGTETLCGSIATMEQSVRFFKQATGCSTVEVLEAATLHPALALQISDKKGTLNCGSDADFIMLDPESLELRSTWIGGQCVYNKFSNHS